MFRKFVDETEIDEWFQETKEALDKKFYKKSYGGSLEDGREEYEKAMKKLLERYDKEYRALDARTQRHEKLSEPKKRFLAWWETTKKNHKKLWKKRKERFKKWRFEKEYTRLMKK